jgi:hypothetical protein
MACIDHAWQAQISITPSTRNGKVSITVTKVTSTMYVLSVNGTMILKLFQANVPITTMNITPTKAFQWNQFTIMSQIQMKASRKKRGNNAGYVRVRPRPISHHRLSDHRAHPPMPPKKPVIIGYACAMHSW